MLEHLDIALRCLIGVVFLAATYGKVHSRVSWREFVASLAAMRVVPARLVPAVAGVVGLAEAAVPVLLLVPPTRRLGHVLAALLLVAFSSGIIITLSRRQRVACRCFGATGAPLGRRHLLRNGLLIAAAAVGVAAAGATGEVAPAGVAVAAVAGAVSGLLFVWFDDITDLFVTQPARPDGDRGRAGGPVTPR
ncbi:MauE/DoxX family redox-associated membrane protein [Micromonospora sp. C28ISP2-4]|uniref:MauE/DoxX family redox-associated membrane protein n=1 Tax=Micromonospora sp. C28ISP2-4 TaxID=3059523 RepID=UPI0026773726|nr:MauE/DoxX family redox-associated membrane protein [Micromonospora sp. C28ISP2-4]MDO3687524.1 MauE/DoxX family redox-associated membrane protein [Micromonospora sp. C28ISP2-4]